MHPVIDQGEIEEIVNLARKYLEPYQPQTYRLQVIPEGVQRENDWYYVLVEPSREDVRSYEFNSLLAEAELDLQKAENRKVLLVPALPG